MEPAYRVPLNQDELALLGELTAILGQVDEQLVVTVSGLIQADRPTTNAVMGSSKIADNANIWTMLIRLRTSDPIILELVKIANAEMQKVSEIRNDFVHALFTAGNMIRFDYGKDLHAWTGGPATAQRVRNPAKKRSASELKAARDQAGRLSCLIAHIGYCLAPHGRETPWSSPWLARLAPTLPPHLDARAARTATEPPSPPRPSEA